MALGQEGGWRDEKETLHIMSPSTDWGDHLLTWLCLLSPVTDWGVHPLTRLYLLSPSTGSDDHPLSMLCPLLSDI